MSVPAKLSRFFIGVRGEFGPVYSSVKPAKVACGGLLGKVHRQQTHLRPLVNLERETVFRRFLKHLHLLMSENFLFFAWFLIRPFSTKATSSSPAAKAPRVSRIQKLPLWRPTLRCSILVMRQALFA